MAQEFPVFTDISPSVSTQTTNPNQSTAGQIIALTKSGDRLYASAPRAALWKSDDLGRTWRQLTYSADIVARGLALPGNQIRDVSADPSNRNRVLAASTNNNNFRTSGDVDGIYLSTDGGSTWRRRWHAKACPSLSAAEGVMFVTSSLAIAWGGCEVAYSTNGGEGWHSQALDAVVFNMIADPTTKVAYACGGPRVWRTTDYTTNRWTSLPVDFPIGQSNPFPEWICPGYRPEGAGGGWHSLALNPTNTSIVYIGAFHANPSVWKVAVTDGATIRAERFPTPSPSASGGVYVNTRRQRGRDGFILLFGTSNFLFAADGEPDALQDWVRLDGGVHVDTHAIVSDDVFSFRIDPDPLSTPRVKDCSGSIWASNDGGVYRSNNCGVNWVRSEGGAISAGGNGGGLSTLYPLKFALVPVANGPPVIAIGTGDNDDFVSLNGGTSWYQPVGAGCADCGDWYSDPLNPTFAMTTSRTSGGTSIRIYSSKPSDWQQQVATQAYPEEKLNLLFYDATTVARPVIQTTYADIASGRSPIFADLAFIMCVDSRFNSSAGEPGPVCRAGNRPRLVRVRQTDKTTISDTIINARLPFGSAIVQVSGGHLDPSYFVWDRATKSLGVIKEGIEWKTLVPGVLGQTLAIRGANQADRFFVNPYDPEDIYVVDSTQSPAVRRLADKSWVADVDLNSAVTINGKFTTHCDSYPSCLINDMIFVPGERTRFAAGKAGVFYSLDGVTWNTLFTTEQIPSVPWALAFDKYSRPGVRSLYVGMNGRGLIRFDNLRNSR